MKATRGFTLVEILIVVVILGILAAIVVPQFTQASTEAKMNSLCSNLQSLRSQIELYKVQHNDTAPAAGTFAAQMTQTSSIAGATSGNKTRTTTYAYGPYLERVPDNPFDNLATITEIGAPSEAGSGGGWAYDPNTGEIYANDTTAHAAL